MRVVKWLRLCLSHTDGADYLFAKENMIWDPRVGLLLARALMFVRKVTPELAFHVLSQEHMTEFVIDKI